MNKNDLQKILSTEYQPTLWRQVLTDVFGARNLNQKPQPIMLPSNGKELAENAFELGFFNTTDDRIIGLYQIDLTDKPQIWRNKVGLRNLLRNIYQTDVDGALVIFVQKDKWRLSFISEIRVLNDDGTIDKKATEPKRYTYLLGKGEKTKTPTDRLSLLTNKKIALEDIRAAFSVEALNNEFYKQISEYFYALVGATTTKGKKTEVREKIMNLPGVAADDRKTYQEFAVRLIGRTVFCWFLREKCSEQGKPLLPEKLLSSDAVQKNRNYYHEILEPLFFQTLNTPMDKRIADLPEGCEKVPFLNGGLFEPQIEDFYNSQSRTGNFQSYALKIPDSWFEGFFKKLEEYNFTIDENSPTEVEISVDPEMLGRIFENLLAEIDPDSGETARKATGSFYTPREIVNYMVDESLLIYLKSKLQTESAGFQSLKSPQATFGGNDWRVGQPHLEYPLNENRWKDKDDELEKTLRRLFSYSDNENPFEKDVETTTKLIRAIDECKILDPACGSGAFPIGVLQRLVYLLGKLDRKSQKWKQAQLDKIDSLIANAGEIDDRNIRGKVTGDLENRKREIERDFANKELDFSRKLFLIENCIYGVDIQPIAAEISKLRCFLTLIVDDTIDERAPNRGVNPLPNLEFKFVTADALLRLPASGLFNSDAQLTELAAVRHEYINSFGERKEAAKLHFKRIQDEIADAQVKNFRENYDRRAFELSRWNPFGHERVDWFDSEWMFGVKAFDIVIGNPPYIRQEKIKHYKTVFAQNYKDVFSGTADILVYFYALGYELLRKDGTLTLITSNKFYRANYGENLRKFLSQKSKIKQIIDFGDAPVFEAAAYASINILQKDAPNGNKARVWSFPQYEKITDFQSGFNRLSFELPQKDLTQESWRFEKPEIIHLLGKIKSNRTTLGKYVKDFNYGIKTGLGEAFVIDEETRNQLIKQDKSSAKIIKPFLRGKDIKRWTINFDNQYLIKIESSENVTHPWTGKPNAEKIFSETYPAIHKRFREKELYEKLIKRYDQGKYFWELRSCAYWKDFETPKIILGRFMNKPTYTFDDKKYLHNDALYFIPRASKFLVAILNSSTSWYFLTKNSTDLQNGYIQALYQNQSQIPIPNVIDSQKLAIENLVDYILFLKETDEAEQVNEYVPNSHLVEQFEEVIDALVYELYFEADFQKAEIHFHKYASRDFPAIENLTRPEKIKTIHAAYQRLRQKDNEIQTNLKLMHIRLADLIMPIKTAR